MSIITKLKSILFGSGQERDRGTRVAVEQEPAAESERAVKESPPEPEPVERPGADETSSAAAEPEPTSGDDEPVDTISGIGDAYASRLADAGITTVSQLAEADAADLAESTDIAEGRLEGWIDQARAH